MTKFSEIPEYIEYINMYAIGNFPEAERHLLMMRDKYIESLSPDERAEISRTIGDVKFKMGDTIGALARYRIAELEAPESFLIKYQFAKFLLEKMSDVPAGLSACEDIIEKLLDTPFAETDGDFGSDEYLRMVSALREGFS